MKFTIAICTRNPGAEVFARTLEAVAGLDFPLAEREVLVVDNGSTPPLRERDLPLPGGSRIVVEAEPGVNRARQTAVREALGDWIVYIDDDNFPDSDYLAAAEAIIEGDPEIGLFCGRIDPEFEVEPEPWLHEFFPQLALIDFPADTRADTVDFSRIPSWTAGMVFRREAGNGYFKVVAGDTFRQSLNRCEDVDFIRWAVAAGFPAGRFRALRMRHRIPEGRIRPAYLRRIMTESGYNMARIHLRETAGLARWRMRLRAAGKWLFSLAPGPRPSSALRRAAAFAYLRGLFAPVSANRSRP